MILTADYHTHTPYSHGKNTVEENVAAAVEKGLKKVAISDHGFSHIAFGLRHRKLPDLMAEIRAAAEKFCIDVLLGIESNICSVRGTIDLKPKDYEKFDVLLCGFHMVALFRGISDWAFNFFGNVMAHHLQFGATNYLVKRNTRAYINALKNNPVDALTHLSFQCACNPLEVAKCAADYGTYIELNGKKTHLTDDELNDIVAKTSARFILNSDAHTADRVGDITRVERQLARLQFPMDRIDNIDGRLPNFRFTEFKKHM